MRMTDTFLNSLLILCLIVGNNTTYLKVTQLSPDPVKVYDHEVPVFKESLDSFHVDQWDLTTNQVKYYFKLRILYGNDSKLIKIEKTLNEFMNFKILPRRNALSTK